MSTAEINFAQCIFNQSTNAVASKLVLGKFKTQMLGMFKTQNCQHVVQNTKKQRHVAMFLPS